MNTESNGRPEASQSSPARFPLLAKDARSGAPEIGRVLTATRPFCWSVRRELWEYRSIYLAPACIAGVIVLGFGFVLPRLPETMRHPMMLDLPHQHNTLSQPFDVAAGLIMGASFIISFYYALDTLYGERRDRSILFWKSLPVSDLTTVLAKAFVLLLALPAISVAITIVTEAIIFLMSSAVLAANGLSVGAFWTQLQPIQTLSALLYHIVTVHILWYAPMYAWLLLISAWSKRAPLLWALLPPFAIVVFERVAFHTAYFHNFLLDRVAGGNYRSSSGMLDPEMRMPIVRFMFTPGLWYGLLFAAAFLFAAARLRRSRGPI
jgi:ABC-2 type transport system permease protein